MYEIDVGKQGANCSAPIRINLRTVELEMGEQLIGVGLPVARIDGTALAHHQHGAFHDGLYREPPLPTLKPSTGPSTRPPVWL